MTTTTDPVRPRAPVRRVSAALHRQPRVRLVALLAAPLTWLVVVYLGSLAVLFASAFWTTDPFTSSVVRTFTWDNFRLIAGSEVYRAVALRTVGAAALVTVVDALIALPMAFYLAKVATPRTRRLLLVAVLMPLWASYLVKAYAWRLMLSQDGLVNWALGPFGLHGPGYGFASTCVVLAYLWLPYMILPIYTGLAQLPASLLDASADLGARPGRTVRSVVLPLVFPSIVAGSIFTFSLSLGDYIAVQVVGGPTQLIGNVVLANITLNLPLAAAFGTVPVAVILLYLFAVRRTGALRAL
jgi:putative spermidine/putrescine transport system permease protein